MKDHGVFSEMPLTAIQPRGWLRAYLLKQRDGLTGHLEHAGKPFNKCSWFGFKRKPVKHWVPYEQNGYWIDGMIRCGHLLKDSFLIRKALKSINYVLNHPDSGGYLGPDFLKARKAWHRWPHTVFFRALMAHYDATGDRRIIKALQRHYLSGDHEVHVDSRNVANVEPLLWLYERTGKRRFLNHALKAYAGYNKLHARDDNSLKNMLSGKRAKEHGVTYNELGKLGAILYMHTGNRRFLRATVNAYGKMERDQELISGVCSSVEQLSGKGALESHETCDIADYTWGLGYLLLATGSAKYADKIEQACFNAAPGAVRADFKALQYFSSPNQVIADRRSNHQELYRGHAWMSYRPNPGTACCPGDVNRIMPNFAGRMWLSDGRGGLAAAMYGASEVTARLGSAHSKVTIIERTDYPFWDRIDFEIHTKEPVKFAFHLRIPGWATEASLEINRQPVNLPLRPGTFVKLVREFKDGDRLMLRLPMKLRLSRWPGGGVGVHRGPLAYSLKIREKWVVDTKDRKSTRQFPAWNLYPASRWNYALAVKPRDLRLQIEVFQKHMNDDPWTIETAPIELLTPVRAVAGWKAVRRRSIVSRMWDGKANSLCKVKGRFVFTPPLPDQATLRKRLSRKMEKVMLVPYGCARLRISVFPDGSLKK